MGDGLWLGVERPGMPPPAAAAFTLRAEPATEKDYRFFLLETCVDTWELRYFVGDALVAVSVLDFGRGVLAKCNVALWRTRAEHTPLCGEFAYQAKFKRRDDLGQKALDRCRRFFLELQQAGHDWLALGTTKTGMVYRLHGNQPQAHE